MTTNQERAAEVIDTEHVKSMRNMRLPNPSKLARALDAAGLLAPELPDHIETSPDNMPDIFTDGGHVYAVLNAGSDSDWERLDPSEATEFALRLLAAADFAEKEKK